MTSALTGHILYVDLGERLPFLICEIRKHVVHHSVYCISYFIVIMTGKRDQESWFKSRVDPPRDWIFFWIQREIRFEWNSNSKWNSIRDIYLNFQNTRSNMKCPKKHVKDVFFTGDHMLEKFEMPQIRTLPVSLFFYSKSHHVVFISSKNLKCPICESKRETGSVRIWGISNFSSIWPHVKNTSFTCFLGHFIQGSLKLFKKKSFGWFKKEFEH